MTWLSVKEVALLMEVTLIAVSKTIYNVKFKFGFVLCNGGECGKVIQVALESLPQHIQDKYHKLLDEAERQECAALITECTDKQREAADHKAGIVHEFELSGMSGTRFIEQYNEQSGETVTLNQLYDWGNADLTKAA